MASNVFIVHKISKTPMATVYKGVVPFLTGIVVLAPCFSFFPQLALFLPNYFMK